MALLNGTYDLTNLSNSSTLVDVFTYANSDAVSGGALSTAILLGIFFVILFRMSNPHIENRLAIASIVCFSLSLLLNVAGFVQTRLLLGFLILLAFSLFIVQIRKQG